eukprot:TRINITY_DN1529_c0_g1_i3.p1 TRINITY_DN1529_c0_g1~~TRINITY_DN1529_c0_g1_i3.p1  ORF type:complete len:588 (+),score=155.80 TRINITY_DN1529_c0_g1_i3:44-1807(+)
MKSSFKWLLAILCAAALIAQCAYAHEGHDHDDDVEGGYGGYPDMPGMEDDYGGYGDDMPDMPADDNADDSDSAADSASDEKESQEPVVVPDYVSPNNVKAFFYELFQDEQWSTRWVSSGNNKFTGRVTVKTPVEGKVPNGEKHLVLLDKARHHAVSHKLETPFRPVNGEIVIQYEVMFVNTLDCGGAYMKLLIEDDSFSMAAFSNESPYVIMFGPDKCGSDSKVHFIFRHQNPVSKVWEEKHLTNPPKIKNDQRSHLYTLHVKSDNTFDLYIDLEKSRSGSLFDDFAPAVNPPAEIADPEDKKPADWVDEAKIPDPTASKPADWDESAPAQIVDEDAVKPADWKDDEPLEIADPEAIKPEDWDDDADGEWEAPKVANPACEDGQCGEWVRPMKPNPAYKGKWVHPLIDNPEYKGEWKARMIPNPNYFEDKTPNNFPAIGAIGFEIWTMTEEITFDNIYLGHSINDAINFAEQTFRIKEKIQGPSKSAASSSSTTQKDISASFKEAYDKIAAYAKENPVPFGIMVVAFVFPWLLLFTRGGSEAPKKTSKKPAPVANDEASDAQANEAEEKAAPAASSTPTKKSKARKD